MAAGSLPVRDLARYQCWEISGQDIRIYLDPAMPARLHPDGPRETGGLLLGYTEASGNKTNIIIEDLTPVPCAYTNDPFYVLADADTPAFETALVRAALAACDSPDSPQVIGYYRTHLRDGLSLSRDDLGLVDAYLTGPAYVFMLVKPARGSEAAAFFVREDGRIPEFSPLVVALEPPPPAPSAPEPRPPRPSPWPGLLLRAAIIVLCTIALVVSVIRYLGAPRDNRYDTAASATPSEPLRIIPDDAGLRILWNLRSGGLQDATRGILTIAESGVESKLLELDRTELAKGSITYVPQGDDVRVSLQVYDATGQRRAVQSARLVKAR